MHCANHESVPGIGVCVDCNKVVCEACTTRLQGRNFCADCLSRRNVPTEALRTGDGPVTRRVVGVLALSAAALLWAVASGVGFLLYLAG